MRRRLAVLAASVASVASLSGSRPLVAQTTSGATFLLLPISARIVGRGGASVADAPGTEAVESNPAALGWLTRSEGALHYAQDFNATRFLAAVAIPRRVFGTFELSWARTDYGSQEARIGPDSPPTGSLNPHDDVFAASYGASLGRRLALGVTFKIIRNDYFSCSGVCTDPDDPGAVLPGASSTGAVDAGLQYDFTGQAPVRVGVAVHHAGLPVQIQDRAQTDELPTEATFGATVDIPGVARRVPGAELRILGEVLTGVASETTGEVRLGAEGIYRKTFALRAGYRHGRGESGGPSFGIGYTAKRFAFDLATQFAGFSAEAGQTPTFVAFRYWF